MRRVLKRQGRYEWESWLVQGWQEEGRWMRRFFRSEVEAEAFAAAKQLELVTPEAPQRPVMTTLTQEEVRDAESAYARLEELGEVDLGEGRMARASLLQAVNHFVEFAKGRLGVEPMPIREARIACLRDKAARGMRERSIVQAESTLKGFEAWLMNQPRYVAATADPDWSPPVHEVTPEDVAGYLQSLRSRAGLVAAPKTRNNARADLRAFFNWCMGVENDRPIPGCVRRWHSMNPAAALPKESERKASPAVLSVDAARDLMRDVEETRDGIFAPYFALALFAGIRPGPGGELYKLARHPHRDRPCREASGRPLIDLERGVITLPADVAKTGRKRVVTIQQNLMAWLSRYGLEAFPPGHDRGVKALRARHGLEHDVLRHSFISYHVGAFRSKASTALEAGNSEAIIDQHYLNLPTEEEGRNFFSILPEVQGCAPPSSGASANGRTELQS